jgi:hypothetical protein
VRKTAGSRMETRGLLDSLKIFVTPQTLNVCIGHRNVKFVTERILRVAEDSLPPAEIAQCLETDIL